MVLPDPPAAAQQIFGNQLPRARAYAELLATVGTERGVIGPREVPRLWERHILNCAVIEELIPVGSEVLDVGSGAGLPGIVLAIARPDCHHHLLDSMERRAAWLRLVVAELGLDTVTVHRGRAEDAPGRLSAPVVTARAVSQLDQLAAWCLPLVSPGGELLAIKGNSAAEELAAARPRLKRLGVSSADIVAVGARFVTPATTVVRLGRTHRGSARGA